MMQKAKSQYVGGGQGTWVLAQTLCEVGVGSTEDCASRFACCNESEQCMNLWGGCFVGSRSLLEMVRSCCMGSGSIATRSVFPVGYNKHGSDCDI